MKIINDIAQCTPEWDKIREGRITGSKLKDIVVKRGSGKKIGFYQLIADRLGIPADDENAMSRGHRLEDEAIEVFEASTGKKVDEIGFCISDFNDYIALSPDGLIENDGKYTEAVEIKCLGSARHIEAIVTKEIPSDYHFQVLQYFIVNEDLQTLHFVFYDPRLVAKPYFHIEVTRESLGAEVEQYKQYQIETIAEVEAIARELEF